MKYFFLSALLALTLVSGVAPARAGESTLLERTKGHILLQVEQHGEAWYVHPIDGKRYYMKDGPTAYEMMRAFGLGISNADLDLAFAGNASILSRIKGRIVLQVEAHGEAYYVHPDDGSLHYLKDGAAAYEIMRSLSLGITDADLAIIPSATFVPLSVPSDDDQINGDVERSTFTHASVPAGIDTVALNAEWLVMVNDLRAEKGLRLLVTDQSLVDTASEYAGIMVDNDYFSHERPDGSSMQEWINTRDVDFYEWGEAGGWTDNYFTENIAWTMADPDQEGFEKLLDDAMAMFLAEGPGGPHYETVYHHDWNSVGVGFAAKDGKVYGVFHYGSLE